VGEWARERKEERKALLILPLIYVILGKSLI